METCLGHLRHLDIRLRADLEATEVADPWENNANTRYLSLVQKAHAFHEQQPIGTMGLDCLCAS